MRLKDLREDHDMTQKFIAEYLHIKQNTYSQYENGQRQIPVEALVLLAKLYNTSLDYILELTDVKEPYPRKNKKSDTL
ncbi:MAG: helix-turn-helix transcriptional regulator [Ruminococcaceae bacterium]|nr:helix-turn-helix transcriptional regulator [Oscillospiraceae bacterium]